MDLKEKIMVSTAFITFLIQSASGFDVNGNAIAPTVSESDIYPCNLAQQKRVYETYIDGQLVQSKYSIMLKYSAVKDVNLDSVKNVKLTDINGIDLGVFQIHSKQRMQLVGLLKIMV